MIIYEQFIFIISSDYIIRLDNQIFSPVKAFHFTPRNMHCFKKLTNTCEQRIIS